MSHLILNGLTMKGRCIRPVKNRPLSFLAQFNCEELASYDTEHLLPDYGVLSFFYETCSQCWGFDPKDKGCARVYWFEDVSALRTAEFPLDMESDSKSPLIGIRMFSKPSCPSLMDFDNFFPYGEDEDTFIAASCEFTGNEPEEMVSYSQLLGWPDVIQDTMYEQCDLVSKGYCLGDGIAYNRIPKDTRQYSKKTAHERWILLFQLDTIENDDFCMMFGDCGHIYFYITQNFGQCHHKRRFSSTEL